MFYDKDLEKLEKRFNSRKRKIKKIKYIEDLFQKGISNPLDVLNIISKLIAAKKKSLLYKRGNVVIPIDLEYLQGVVDNYYEYCEATGYAEFVYEYPIAWIYQDIISSLDVQ